MDIAQRLRLAFDAECREHLAAMRRLARRGAGAPDIADVFRRAHSLKGAARAVDRQGIETVAHRLESLLEHIQRGGLILDGAVERVIQTALDGIEDLAGGPDEAAMPLPVVAELDVLLAGTTQAGAPPPAVPEFAAAPAVPPPGSAPLDEPAVAVVEPARPVPTASPAPVHATVRVAAEHLDRLMVTSGRFLAQVTAQNELALQLRTLQQRLAALQRDWERARLAGRRHDGASGGADSLQAETQLAAIDKEISALVRGATQIVRDQKAATWQLRLLVDQLQDDVRQARLVPAEEIFSGFGPMVRELAREQNKQIVLTLMGLEIEADRMILQALKDPVMHALRNAIGHGAEPAQARVAAGDREARVRWWREGVGAHARKCRRQWHPATASGQGRLIRVRIGFEESSNVDAASRSTRRSVARHDADDPRRRLCARTSAARLSAAGRIRRMRGIKKRADFADLVTFLCVLG